MRVEAATRWARCVWAVALVGAIGASDVRAGSARDAAAMRASGPFETESWAPLLSRDGGQPLAPAALAERPPRLALQTGERLEYVVSYLGVPVGWAFVGVAELFEATGRRVAHLVAGAETNAFFSAFYPVRDRAEAWVDLDAARTFESRWWMGHGRRRIYEALSYDWPTHSLRVVRHRLHSGRGRELELDFGPFVYDALDLFFTLRGWEGRPGARVEVPVYASKKIYSLLLEDAEPQTIRTAATGPVAAWRLRATTLLDGVPKESEGKGVLWISQAPPHLPLRLEGWFRGSETFRVTGLRVELTRYQPGRTGRVGSAVVGAAHAAGAAPGRAAAALTRSPVPTRAGRPIWEVPAAIQAERQRRGWQAFERRFRFAKRPGATWPLAPLGPLTEVPTAVGARP